jgi:hypothetical protein
MDVFSTELGIQLNFIKTSEFRGGGGLTPPRYATGSSNQLPHLVSKQQMFTTSRCVSKSADERVGCVPVLTQVVSY